MRRIRGSIPPIVVIDSGTSGNTAEQVAKVQNSTGRGEKICVKIGEITKKWVRAFAEHNAHALGKLMTANHTLLAELDVSTPALDAIVDLAVNAGAHGAKLAGAGGGGVVIAVASEPKPILAAAARAGYTAFVTQMHPVRMELP